jgi:radical SAM superfamily enzyme YgiQ (UPF0313 family)
MTFQRKTAKGIIDLLRTRRPRARVVVGGYDPSLAPEAYTEDPDGGVDFIVRGEGEITFRELLRALEAQRGYDPGCLTMTRLLLCVAAVTMEIDQPITVVSRRATIGRVVPRIDQIKSAAAEAKN